MKEPVSTQLTSPDISRDIQAFLIDCQSRSLSPRTVEFYGEELNFFRLYLLGQGAADLSSVTSNSIRAYLASLSARRTAGGIHAAYRSIRTFLRWCAREYEMGELLHLIERIKGPKRPQELLEPLDQNVFTALLATCERDWLGDRDRAIFMALLDTGCRANEFLAIDREDVDLAAGSVIIRHGKGNKHRVTFMGKRTLKDVMRYLRRRDDTADPLWISAEGTRLTYDGLRSMVTRRSRRAGVGAPSLHSFRRSFALLCLRNHMDVYSLQKLMGHADLTVLRRYLAQTSEDLQEAHARASPVDRL